MATTNIPQQILESLLPLEHISSYIEQTNSEGGVTEMAQTNTGRVIELRSGRSGMTLTGIHIHNHAVIQTYTSGGRTYSRIIPTANEQFRNGTIFFDASFGGNTHNNYPVGESNTPVNNIDDLIQIIHRHSIIYRIEVVGGDYCHDLIATTELRDYEIIDSRPATEMRVDGDGTFIMRGNIHTGNTPLSPVTIDRGMDSYELLRKLIEIKITDKNKFALADLITTKTKPLKKQLVTTKRKIRIKNDIN